MCASAHIRWRAAASPKGKIAQRAQHSVHRHHLPKKPRSDTGLFRFQVADSKR
jgi:hypothetical protein